VKRGAGVGLSRLALVLGITAVVSGCASNPSDDGDGRHTWPHPPSVMDVGPRWCPNDRERIAYTHYPKDWDELQELGGPTVWIVTVGTGRKELVARGWVYDWLPDGTKLLCGGSDDDIWFVDLSTGDASMILSEPQPLGEADIDQSGEKIAYVVDDLRIGGIWVLSLGSMAKHRMSGGYHPSWRPDSAQIIRDGLVIIRDDGTTVGAIPLPDTVISPEECCWRPDGGAVAFTGYRSASSHERVYVVGLDGSDLKIVAEGGRCPSWSPDGGKIAYSGLTDDGKWVAIWTVNSDGTARTQITFP